MIYHPFSGAHFTADQYGNVLRSTIEVRDAITGQKAVLYKDMFGATTLTNSFQTNSDGFFVFYTKTGRYNISATANGITTTYQNVDIIGVAAQEFDVSENGGTSTAFNTIQDAVNYLSRVVPSHNASQRYKLNIYGNVGALTSYSNVPLILNCVDSAQMGDMALYGCDIEVIGDLTTGNIIGERTRLTTSVSSTLSCKRIKADRQSDFLFNSNVTSSEASATDTSTPVFWANSSSSMVFNAITSINSSNYNSAFRAQRSSVMIVGDIDISSNVGWLGQSFAGYLRFSGASLSSLSVKNNGLFSADGGSIYFVNSASFTKINAETNSACVYSTSGANIFINFGAITANGFSYAAYADRGIINASGGKILQGTSSNFANITTNAYQANGSAIFI